MDYRKSIQSGEEYTRRLAGHDFWRAYPLYGVTASDKEEKGSYYLSAAGSAGFAVCFGNCRPFSGWSHAEDYRKHGRRTGGRIPAYAAGCAYGHDSSPGHASHGGAL